MVGTRGSGRFPFIDLSAGDEAAAARALDVAGRDLGFFFASGHGVARETVERAYEEALSFFDLPMAAKLAVSRPSDSVSRGYNRLADQSHAATFEADGTPQSGMPPDLQESFAIGQRRVPALPSSVSAETAALAYAPNLWPAGQDRLENTLAAYYDAMALLSERLMSLFALALGLPRDFFVPMLDRHASILRLVYYPEQHVPPRPGQWRAGPHTDFGTLTILRMDDAPGGLQVRDAEGNWLDVAAPPDAFVVNIGDLMQRWTNNRWISSIHRVVNPPREKSTDSRRLSLVFFHEPNPDAVIRCLPTCGDERNETFPEIVASEHRRRKVAALRGIAPAAEGSHGL